MKTLPNGLRVFNATPHIIRFWKEDWDEPVEVEPDTIINATVSEKVAELGGGQLRPGVAFVTPRFISNDDGRAVIATALAGDADLIIGSIIAAQAYPRLVYAMTPAPGYERVPPAEKRANPDKFTVF